MPDPAAPILLEVCVDSLADAQLAAASSAQRIELNAALPLGGLTPSLGLTELVLAAVQPLGCQVIAMVRPRIAGFAYSDDELTVMHRDIDRLLHCGVDGIALGVLDASGCIDESANRALIQPVLSRGKQAVFHRAFDVVPDQADALKSLIKLRFKRVLTSGGAATALQGAQAIRALIQQANGQIEVMPGCGIRPDNVAELIHITGCTQVHASLSRAVRDPAWPSNTPIRFNASQVAEGTWMQTDRDQIDAMQRVLRGRGV